MGTKWSVNRARLEVGRIYPTTNYGDLEVISDDGSRNVTVIFINTKTIVQGLHRSNVVRGKVKDPSLKDMSKVSKIKVGVKSENSYLRLLDRSFISGEKIWYKCILCSKEYTLSRKYTECDIPSSCGCLKSLKPKGEDFTGKNSRWRTIYRIP